MTTTEVQETVQQLQNDLILADRTVITAYTREASKAKKLYSFSWSMYVIQNIFPNKEEDKGDLEMCLFITSISPTRESIILRKAFFSLFSKLL